MKLTAQLKLQPTTEQANALRETLVRVNVACNFVSEIAWNEKVFHQFPLHRLCYKAVRNNFDLSAQITVRLLAKVADAYKKDKRTKRTKRTFKPLAAISYDSRILRFDLKRDAVSIWTLNGRIKVPFVCGERQRQLLLAQRGESDLALVNDQFYLFASCDVQTPEPVDIDGFLGVDRGIINVAVTSDGTVYGGEQVIQRRKRMLNNRKTIQKALAKRKQRKESTRSVRRSLKRNARKESNHSKTSNHTVAKSIVASAKAQSFGIALEQLQGIRNGKRFRRKQRYLQHSWAFHDLQQKLTYKAALAGLPVVFVPAAYTSQTCPVCDHCCKQNRVSQSSFVCRQCGFSAHADYVGALNIQRRASVSMPDAREPYHSTGKPVALAVGH